MNDILAQYQNKFTPEQLISFKEFAYRMATTMHSPEELDKVVGNYKSEELDKRLSILSDADFEPYKWQEITESSYSNLIKKQFDKFHAVFKVINISIEQQAGKIKHFY